MSDPSARADPGAPALARLSFAGLAATVVLLFLPRPALACDLVVEPPEAVRIEYNPFAVGASSGPLDIVFRNRADTACALRLLLIDDIGQPLPALSLGGVIVEFRPRETSGLFRRDVEPGAFLLDIAPGATVRAELDAAVVLNAVVEAGDHPADLRLSILPSDPATAAPPPVPLRVILRSAPRAQVNIAGAAGAFASGSSVEVVDFGDAVAGTTRRVFLQVRANTEATLSVTSEHHGVLRHVELQEGGTVLAYALELDGDVVDLSDRWTRAIDPPRTLDGVSLPMDFTLGEVAGRMSGPYEDLITIDITPD